MNGAGDGKDLRIDIQELIVLFWKHIAHLLGSPLNPFKLCHSTSPYEGIIENTLK
jgi:hypothetical protein